MWVLHFWRAPREEEGSFAGSSSYPNLRIPPSLPTH
jgi:hypothetical protein